MAEFEDSGWNLATCEPGIDAVSPAGEAWTLDQACLKVRELGGEVFSLPLKVLYCLLMLKSEQVGIDVEDAFVKMWDQQVLFMQLLVEERGFPSSPMDLSVKASQKFIKGIVHECQDELFEAVKELKNSKGHRATDVSDFDRAKYLEELVDAQHYLIEVAVLSGISRDEFLAAYMKKGGVNRRRIEDGY